MKRFLLLFAAAISPLSAALADPPPPVIADGAIVQSPAEALAQDAAEYATLHTVSPGEALARLVAQQASVAATDRLQALHRDRLAGIVIEHEPAFRLVVELTGDAPVPDEAIVAGGMVVPVVFRTGAPATRDRIVEAIVAHQVAIAAALPHPPGLAVDARSGTLAVLLRPQDIGEEGAAALAARLGAIAGVPVRLRAWNDIDSDLAGDLADDPAGDPTYALGSDPVVGGGSRVIGGDTPDGRRFVCTSGFVVTDGARTAITTAAHCPDDLRAIKPDRASTTLTMIGAWGARYQDVQIHTGGDAMEPLFYADTARREARAVTSWRNRASTRTGDFVCHRGERTGYSCADVAFVDFAPPGDLCAGPCAPSWVAVAGPGCRSGDSGGPVFSGTIAFGMVKGASYTSDGACRLYYYMSTDDLPPGWTLLHR